MDENISKQNKVPGSCDTFTKAEEIEALQKYLKNIREVQEEHTTLGDQIIGGPKFSKDDTLSGVVERLGVKDDAKLYDDVDVLRVKEIEALKEKLEGPTLVTLSEASSASDRSSINPAQNLSTEKTKLSIHDNTTLSAEKQGLDIGAQDIGLSKKVSGLEIDDNTPSLNTETQGPKVEEQDLELGKDVSKVVVSKNSSAADRSSIEPAQDLSTEKEKLRINDDDPKLSAEKQGPEIGNDTAELSTKKQILGVSDKDLGLSTEEQGPGKIEEPELSDHKTKINPSDPDILENEKQGPGKIKDVKLSGKVEKVDNGKENITLETEKQGPKINDNVKLESEKQGLNINDHNLKLESEKQGPNVSDDIKSLSEYIQGVDDETKIQNLESHVESVGGQEKSNSLSSQVTKTQGVEVNDELYTKKQGPERMKEPVLEKEVKRINPDKDAKLYDNVVRLHDKDIINNQGLSDEKVQGLKDTSTSSVDHLSSSIDRLKTTTSETLDNTPTQKVKHTKDVDKLEVTKEGIKVSDNIKPSDIITKLSDIKDTDLGQKKETINPGKTPDLSSDVRKLGVSKDDTLSEILRNLPANKGGDLEELYTEKQGPNTRNDNIELGEEVQGPKNLNDNLELSTKSQTLEVEEDDVSLWDKVQKLGVNENEDLSSFIDTLGVSDDEGLSTEIQGPENTDRDIELSDTTQGPGEIPQEQLSGDVQKISVDDSSSLSDQKQGPSGVSVDDSLSDIKRGITPNLDDSLSDYKANIKPNLDDSLSDYKADIKPNLNDSLSDIKEGVKPNLDDSLSDIKEGIEPNLTDTLSDIKEGVKPNQDNQLSNIKEGIKPNLTDTLSDNVEGIKPKQDNKLSNVKEGVKPNQTDTLSNTKKGPKGVNQDDKLSKNKTSVSKDNNKYNFDSLGNDNIKTFLSQIKSVLGSRLGNSKNKDTWTEDDGLYDAVSSIDVNNLDDEDKVNLYNIAKVMDNEGQTKEALIQALLARDRGDEDSYYKYLLHFADSKMLDKGWGQKIKGLMSSYLSGDITYKKAEEFTEQLKKAALAGYETDDSNNIKFDPKKKNDLVTNVIPQYNSDLIKKAEKDVENKLGNTDLSMTAANGSNVSLKVNDPNNDNIELVGGGVWKGNSKVPRYKLPGINLFNATDVSTYIRWTAEETLGRKMHGTVRQTALDAALFALCMARRTMEKATKSNRDRLPGGDFGMLSSLASGQDVVSAGVSAAKKVVKDFTSQLKSKKDTSQPMNRPKKETAGWNQANTAIGESLKISPVGSELATGTSIKGLVKGFLKSVARSVIGSLMGGEGIDYTFQDNYLTGTGIQTTLNELCSKKGPSVQTVEDLKSALNNSEYMTVPRRFTSTSDWGSNWYTLDSNDHWEIIFEPYAGVLNGNKSFLPAIEEINVINRFRHNVWTGYGKWIPFISFDLGMSRLVSKQLSLFEGEISYPTGIEFTNELRLSIADDQYKSWRTYFERCMMSSVYSSKAHGKDYYKEYHENQGKKIEQTDLMDPNEFTIIDKNYTTIASYKNVCFQCKIYSLTPQLYTISKYDLLVTLKDMAEERSGEVESGGTDLSLVFSIVGENADLAEEQSLKAEISKRVTASIARHNSNEDDPMAKVMNKFGKNKGLSVNEY